MVLDISSNARLRLASAFEQLRSRINASHLLALQVEMKNDRNSAQKKKPIKSERNTY